MDLSLVSADDLIAELKSRYDALIIGGMEVPSPDNEYSEFAYVCFYDYKGNGLTCLGLSVQLTDFLKGQRALLSGPEG